MSHNGLSADAIESPLKNLYWTNNRPNCNRLNQQKISHLDQQMSLSLTSTVWLTSVTQFKYTYIYIYICKSFFWIQRKTTVNHWICFRNICIKFVAYPVLLSNILHAYDIIWLEKTQIGKTGLISIFVCVQVMFGRYKCWSRKCCAAHRGPSPGVHGWNFDWMDISGSREFYLTRQRKPCFLHFIWCGGGWGAKCIG